ncbi:Retrotransposon gag protein [Abeliophyllum distichum]|uniref:Retrotransposon gag protein n=1 Tax=Abeliophyllum distichum TaxID=126358 RepID=A0ABD1SZI2_9LAMI
MPESGLTCYLHGRFRRLWILRASLQYVSLGSARKKKTAMGLMQVIQDKGETLREYMSRFNRATLDIKNLQMPSVVTTLLSGLRNHSFRASLSKKPPESMTELLRRGEEYIDQEEVLKSTRADREPYESGSRKRQCGEHMMNKPNTRLMTEYKYRPSGEVVNVIS